MEIGYRRCRYGDRDCSPKSLPPHAPRRPLRLPMRDAPEPRAPIFFTSPGPRSIILANHRRPLFQHAPLLLTLAMQSSSGLRNPWRNLVARFRRLQKVGRHLDGQLAHLSPLTQCLIVATFMLRVKVDKGRREAGVVPHLSQKPQVWLAHQLLPDDVDTVC